jgi:hypothetical protein
MVPMPMPRSRLNSSLLLLIAAALCSHQLCSELLSRATFIACHQCDALLAGRLTTELCVYVQ